MVICGRNGEKKLLIGTEEKRDQKITWKKSIEAPASNDFPGISSNTGQFRIESNLRI